MDPRPHSLFNHVRLLAASVAQLPLLPPSLSPTSLFKHPVHLQLSVHFSFRKKHSQYFLRHADLRHLQPALVPCRFDLGVNAEGLRSSIDLRAWTLFCTVEGRLDTLSGEICDNVRPWRRRWEARKRKRGRGLGFSETPVAAESSSLGCDEDEGSSYWN